MSEFCLYEAEDKHPTKGQSCMREMWWRDNGKERKQYGEAKELQRHGGLGGGDNFLTKSISVHDGVWCPLSNDSLCVSDIIQRLHKKKGADVNWKFEFQSRIP